jgi:hypothetical protein
MVGTTGFEPATSRTPSVRATRLRYVPTVRVSLRPATSVSLVFEKGQDGEEFFVQIEQEFPVRLRMRNVLLERRSDAANLVIRVAGRARSLGCAKAIPLREMFSRARDCETLFVEQALDFENGFDVLATI